MRQKPEVTEQMLQHRTGIYRLDSLVGEVLTLARMESGCLQPKEDYIDPIETALHWSMMHSFEAKTVAALSNCSWITHCTKDHHSKPGELLLRALII